MGDRGDDALLLCLLFETQVTEGWKDRMGALSPVVWST
jgi:hypothetical protein